MEGLEFAAAKLSARRFIRELAQGILDCLCPAHCPACGAPGTADDGLCPLCRERLLVVMPPHCRRCGSTVLAPAAPCGEDHRRLRGLVFHRAPFHYRGAAGDMVRRAKFQADRAALRFLGRAMAASLQDWAGGPGRRSILVSVPLHPSRLRRRGFDQAAALAQEVGERLKLRYLPRALRRCRETLPQGDPRVTSREANVRGAFEVRRLAPLSGRSVVLVDDVRTSGSTARECGAILHQAGAASVALLTAARAEGPQP